MKPVALNKQGEKLLSSNPKFWVLFVKLIADKIKDNNRQEIKEFVMGHLAEC
jgi:hypothetical protein